MLHQSYNAAANRSVDLSVLDEVPSQATRSWVLFSLLEMQDALKACSNVSAPGPNHITWQYLKIILANNTCAVGILSLANACLLLHYWPRHFKKSVSVIIPKPGKPAYNTSKAFRPIVLLFFFFFFVHQFITWCSVAVCGRLSTTSSLQF